MSNLRKRIASGVAANGASQLANTVIQLVSVPLFLHFWGPTVSGEWLILSTLPGFLAMSDLSLCTAAGTEMTLREASGNRQSAVRMFHGTWTALGWLSLLVAGITTPLLFGLSWTSWFNFSSLSHAEASIIGVLLVAQVLLSQQVGLLHAGYRATGSYAAGIRAGVVLRVAEFGSTIMIVGALSGGPFAVAAGTLVAKVLGWGLLARDLRSRAAWLDYRWDPDWLATVKPLLGPALSLNLFPLGHAISLQGSIALVSALFGPSTAMVFSTTRTLARLTWQVMSALSNTLFVEFSRALGAGELETARRLHRRAFQLNLWIALTGSLFTLAAGPTLYRYWTGSHLTFDMQLLVGLVLLNVIGATWSTSYLVPMSVNRHQGIAWLYVVATSTSFVLAYVLGSKMGLSGVVCGIMVAEFLFACLVLRIVISFLHDELRSFIPAVLMPPLNRRGRVQPDGDG